MDDVSSNKIDKYTEVQYQSALKKHKYIIDRIDPLVKLLFINSEDENKISINLFDTNKFIIEQWGNKDYLMELEDLEMIKGVCLKDKCIDENIIRYKRYTSITVPIENNRSKSIAILNMILPQDFETNKYYKSLLFIKENIKNQLNDREDTSKLNGLRNKIKEREKLFTDVMESFNMPTLILNYPDLKVDYISNVSVELINSIVGIDYSKERMLGSSLYEIRNINNNSTINSMINRIEENKFRNLIKSSIEIKNKQNRTYKFTDTPIYDESGSVELIVISGLDITEESEYLTAKNNFFSFISHELRSPANVIISASQLLLTDKYKSELDSKIINHIKSIENNSYRLLRLLNNFLDLEKSQAGFLDLNLENHDIVYLTEEITNSITELTNEKGISVIFDTLFEEKIIALDIDKYEKIILNILSNAIKFTPEYGEIFINLYKDEDYVVTSIRDTGIGIKDKDFENIFEKFNKLKDERPLVESGTGLGLNLVKTLVEIMDGMVEVKSKVGRGTEFIVYLPNKKIKNQELSLVKRSKQEMDHITNIEFSDIK